MTAAAGDLGTHLKLRRLELGLTQKGAAEQIGVSEDALRAWELGGAEPKAPRLAAIRKFLGGGLPWDRAGAPELVRRLLEARGNSLRRLAADTGLSPETLANLAAARYLPTRRSWERLKALDEEPDRCPPNKPSRTS